MLFRRTCGARRDVHCSGRPVSRFVLRQMGVPTPTSKPHVAPNWWFGLVWDWNLVLVEQRNPSWNTSKPPGLQISAFVFGGEGGEGSRDEIHFARAFCPMDARSRPPQVKGISTPHPRIKIHRGVGCSFGCPFNPKPSFGLAFCTDPIGFFSPSALRQRSKSPTSWRSTRWRMALWRWKSPVWMCRSLDSSDSRCHVSFLCVWSGSPHWSTSCGSVFL